MQAAKIRDQKEKMKRPEDNAYQGTTDRMLQTVEDKGEKKTTNNSKCTGDRLFNKRERKKQNKHFVLFTCDQNNAFIVMEPKTRKKCLFICPSVFVFYLPGQSPLQPS